MHQGTNTWSLGILSDHIIIKSIPHLPAYFLWKTAFSDIGNMQEDVGFFMIFTGLTAPLSYAYRIIFGWYSSNAPLGFKDSPSHNQWISFRVTWRSSSGVFSQRKALRSIRFIRIQYPESESVPLEDLYRSTPTVAERKHAAWVWMEKAVGRITLWLKGGFAVLSTRKQIWLSMPIYVKHEKYIHTYNFECCRSAINN